VYVPLSVANVVPDFLNGVAVVALSTLSQDRTGTALRDGFPNGKAYTPSIFDRTL